MNGGSAGGRVETCPALTVPIAVLCMIRMELGMVAAIPPSIAIIMARADNTTSQYE